MTEPAAGSREAGGQAAEDREWIRLTDGMEPYERFRFIARRVLARALRQARAYVDDDRIFESRELADEATLEEHLRELDEELREDGSLDSLEREFLCAAVSEVMEDNDLEAGCVSQLLRLAGPLEPVDGTATNGPSEP